MPFELTCTLSVFQRLINLVLGSLRFTTTLAYLDDILILSADISYGIVALKQVLDRLREANLTLRLSKCFLFRM